MNDSRTSLAKGAGYVAVVLSILILIFASVHKAKLRPAEAAANSSRVAARVSGESSSSRAQFAPKVAEAYGKLPLAFEENKGQTDSQVRFLSHGSGYELFLTPEEAVLSLRRAKPAGAQPMAGALDRAKLWKESVGQPSVLRMQFAGTNPAPKIEGLDHLPRLANYFIGNNPKDWRTGISSYGRVAYRDVYPGIDLIFYGNQRRLEYDYVVAPGADVKAIALDVEGARKLRIDAHGNLLLSVAGNSVELEKPIVYQTIEGARREVAGNYVLAGHNKVAFNVADYDRTQPLVVDPVLVYSTYLGGSTTGDSGFGIAVDSSGDAYVTGGTFNATFPTGGSTTGLNKTPPAGSDVAANGAVFISELNPSGTQELAFTYLAGNDGEFGLGISLDASDNVYVTGQTFSTNYPTTTAAISTAPAVSGGNAFISKLTSDLSTLSYSSYIGNGSNGDEGVAIAAGCQPKSGTSAIGCILNNLSSIQANGLVYVTGITFTSAASFPISGGFLVTNPDTTNGVAFLTAIDTTAANPTAALVYSTFLGGNGTDAPNFLGIGDEGTGVTADSSGDAYITGATTSTNFPVTASPKTAAYQSSALNTNASGFVSEISTITANNGSASLLYSSYLTGAASPSTPYAYGTAIALGPNNDVYVTGVTALTDFPQVNAYPVANVTAGVAFVTLMSTTGTTGAVPYSTLFGGTNGNAGFGIQADSQGYAYFTGQTGSTDFPVTSGAYQTALGTGATENAFLTELNPGGTNTGVSCTGAACLVYSTYFGGSGTDLGFALALASGATPTTPANAYMAGQTTSTNFPTSTGAFQGTLSAGQQAAFAAELTVQPTVSVSPLSLAFGSQTVLVTSAPMDVTLTNNTSTAIAFTTAFTGPNAADFAVSGGTCTTTVPASSSCTVGVTFTPSNPPSAESATLLFIFGAPSNPSAQVALTGTGTVAPPPASFSISSVAAFPGQLVTTTSSPETLTITNNGAAALPITSVTISGADAADFAASPGGANACAGNSVPANSSCTYNVTFTPAAGTAGTLTATLTVTSGATSKMDSLSGTAWDFSLTAPATTTATRGTPDTFNVTVNSLGGFTGTVALTCSAAIQNGGCSVTTPSNGEVAAGGTATVTVVTKAVLPPPAGRHTPPISRRQLVLLLLGLALLFVVPTLRRTPARLGLASVALLFVFLAGCAGTPGTRTGNYTLTITGTSGAVTHSTTVELTVD
jgi:hypothetical protein